MKKFNLYFLTAIACIYQFACTTSSMTASSARVEQEIKSMEQQLSQVYQSSDVAAAERIYGPKYTHTYGVPARTATRAEIMESYRNTTPRGGNIQSFSCDVETVQAYGNTAVAKGSFKRKSKDNNGNNTDLEGLFTHVWVKGTSGWQLVASHNSPKVNVNAGK